jgi:hypothetical protein
MSTTATPLTSRTRLLARWAGLLAIIAGIIMIVAGGVVWGVVSSQLADQHITVSEDASFLANAPVTGPFSALAQADAINMHATAMADGKTYAQLEKDDPIRATVMMPRSCVHRCSPRSYPSVSHSSPSASASSSPYWDGPRQRSPEPRQPPRATDTSNKAQGGLPLGRPPVLYYWAW